MKKLLLFLFFIFISLSESYSQQYKINVSGYVAQGSSSCGTINGLRRVTLIYKNGRREDIHKLNYYINKSYSFTRNFNQSNPVVQVEFFTRARHKNWVGDCRSGREATKKVSVSIPCNSVRYNKNQIYQERIKSGYALIEVFPLPQIKFTNGSSIYSTQTACETSPVKLTSEYKSYRSPSTVYKWEFFDPVNKITRNTSGYQALIDRLTRARERWEDCINFDGGGGGDIPRAPQEEKKKKGNLQKRARPPGGGGNCDYYMDQVVEIRRLMRNYSPKTEQISIWRPIASKNGQAAIDLYLSNLYSSAADRKKALNNLKIQVRLNPGCNGLKDKSRTLSVQFLPEPPKIAKAPTFNQPLCSYSDVKGFVLYFKRQLFAHEKIEINLLRKFQNGSYVPEDNNVNITSLTRVSTNVYKYTWRSSRGKSIKGGDYRIEVSGFNKANNSPFCKQYKYDFKITVPTPITFNAVKVQDELCYNSKNGKIKITASGGTGSYVYSLNNGSTWSRPFGGTITLSNQAPGTYTIKLKDSNGCVDKTKSNVKVSIGRKSKITHVVTTSQTKHTSAPGNSDGSIRIGSVSGGTPISNYFNYTVLLKGSASNTKTGKAYTSGFTIPNLPAGIHKIIYKDKNNCTQQYTLPEIKDPKPIVFSVSAVTPDCYQGQGRINIASISGGYPKYTVIIKKNGSTIKTLSNITSSTFVNVTSGNYVVLIKDTRQGKLEKGITVSAQSQVKISSINISPIKCYNGKSTVRISATGGKSRSYQYAIWKGSSTVWQNSNTFSLAANTSSGYRFRIRDRNITSCTSVISGVRKISQPALLAVTNISVVDNKVFNGSVGKITLALGGGTSPYSVTWKKKNSSFTKTGQTITGLKAGFYTATIKDANGCNINSREIEVKELPELKLQLKVTKVITCNGGKGNLQAIVTGGSGSYTYKWKRNGVLLSNSRNVLTNTIQGNYSVTVNDSHTNKTAAINLTEPSKVTLSIIKTDITCFNANNGKIKLVTNGGSGNYLYSIDNKASYKSTSTLSNNTIVGLSKGNYNVWLKDSKGCEIVGAKTTTVSEPSDINITSTSIINCDIPGGKTGSIAINIIGGNGGYTYKWTKNGTPVFIKTTKNINNLYAGLYKIEVTDSKGCKKNKDFEVKEPKPINVSIKQTKNILCFGESSASLLAEVKGGYPLNSVPSDFTYKWYLVNGGSKTLLNSDFKLTELKNKQKGTYRVEVNDSKGESAFAELSVNQPGKLNVNLSSSKDVSCFGGADGEITINVTGGVSTYSYKWSKQGDIGFSLSSKNVSNLPKGVYSVEVTDANNCKVTSINVEIKQPVKKLTIDSFNSENLKGFETNDGKASVEVSGGTPNYSYEWREKGKTTKIGSSKSINSLKAGEYELTIKDINNCSLIKIFKITQPNKLEVSKITQVNDILCFGDSNVNLTASIQGGTIPYTYKWYKKGSATVLSTKNALNTITGGTYVIKVTDKNLIKTEKEYVVNQPLKLEFSKVDVQNVLCYKGATGSISVEAKGGTAPYTYSWKHGATGSSISSLTGGDYTVTIRDKNLCEISKLIKVTTPATGLSISTEEEKDVTGFGLSNGSIKITANGGTPGYSYQWKDSTGKVLGSTSNELLNISGGTYTLLVSDKGNCTSTSTHIIKEPLLLEAKVEEVSILCNGGTGQLRSKVTGGVLPYSYKWTDSTGKVISTSTFIEEVSGVYNLEVTDKNNNKSKVSSINLVEPAVLAFGTINVVDVLCYKGATGSISVEAKGGTAPYTYSWKHGATGSSISSLTGGDYTVTIRDKNLCEISKLIKVTTPATGLSISTEEEKDVTGFGLSNGSIKITANGGTPGYSYQWKDSTGKVLGSTTNELLNISGGTYTLLLSDKGNCTSTSTHIIKEPLLLEAKVEEVSILCNGGTGQLRSKVTGGVLPYAYKWTDSTGKVISTSTFIEEVSGVYNLEVTDKNNNKSKVSSINLVEPAVLAFGTINVVDVLCYKGATGSISVEAKGGTAPYTYSWKHGATGSSISSLTGGDYTVTIRDKNLCEISKLIKVTTPASGLSISTEEEKDVTGFGLSNGSIKITANGGTPGYSYQWKDSTGKVLGSTSNELLNISGGTYTLLVSDKGNCTSTSTHIIKEPLLLEAKVEEVSILCNGGTGQLRSKVTGGVLPYSYKWTDSTGKVISTSTFIEEVSGVYNLEVTDKNNNKSKVSSINLVEPAVLAFGTINVVDVLCYKGATGSISVEAKGGTAPYTYSWKHGATGSSISSLTGGDYTVTIRDKNLCEISKLIKVTTPATGLSISTEEEKDVTGFGLSNGSIKITANGGTPGYSYQWKDSTGKVLGSTTNELLNISGGTYTLLLSDKGNCTSTSTHIIKEPLLLEAKVEEVSILCNGGTGQLRSKVTGGVLPYAYKWTDSTGKVISTSTFIEEVSGVYNLEVTDKNNNKSKVSSINLSEPLKLEFSKLEVVDINCYGGSTGSILVEAKGGTAPYTYSWKHSTDTNKLISGLKQGVYSVTITDKNGCSITNDSIKVNEPELYEISETNLFRPTSDLINDGRISIKIVGGVSPYNYLWKNEKGDIIKDANSSLKDDEINLLGEGTYTIRVTDSKGCIVEETYNLANPGELLVSVEQLQEITCYNGKSAILDVITIGGAGGNKYTWYNASDDSIVGNKKQLTNIVAGTYYVIVDNAAGIKEKSPLYEVKEPTKIELDFLSENVSCNKADNGSFTFNVKGGNNIYKYRYAFEGTGYSSWIIVNSNTAEVKNLKPGNHKIQLKDGNNCFALNSEGKDEFVIKITEPLQLEITELSLANPTGFGLSNGHIETSIKGGTAPYTYSWEASNGVSLSSSLRIENLQKGTYTLKVKDSKGCNTEKTFELTEPVKLEVSINRNSIISCNGSSNGEIEAVVKGGVKNYTYKWHKEGNTSVLGTKSVLSNLSAGIYYVIITDANNNTVTSSKYELTEPLVLVLKLTSDYTSCGTGNDWEIKSTVTGGTAPYTYLWNTGDNTSDLTNFKAGVYTLTVVDVNGCKITKEVELVAPLNLEITELSLANPTGFGLSNGHIETSIKGGTAPYTYSWEASNGVSLSSSLRIENLKKGTYTLKVKDSKGCSTEKTFKLIEPEKLEVSLKRNSIISCNGSSNGEIEAVVKGGVKGYTYKWHKEGSPSVVGTKAVLGNLSGGIYYVIIIDANNNTVTSSKYELTEPSILTLGLASGYVSCGTGNDWEVKSTVTGGTAPYIYLWNTGDNSSNLTNVKAGSYTLTVVDVNGCKITKEVELVAPLSLEIIELSLANPTGFGLSNGHIETSIKGGTAPYTYSWVTSSGVSLPSNLRIENLQKGRYTLKVKDSKGCSTEKTFKLTEPEKLEVSIKRNSVISCNGFSNGELQAIVNGGVQGYTYEWYKEVTPLLQGTTSTLSNLSGGTYYVIITDANNNTVTSSKYELIEPSILILALNADYVNCGTGNDWEIKTTVLGGTAPYTYLWNTGDSTSNLTNVKAGSYALTVVDVNGCKITKEVKLIAPLNLEITELSLVNPTGFGLSNGHIETSIKGGTAPYTYTWVASNGISLPSNLHLENLQKGTYELKVKDSKGCSTEKTFELSEPEKLEVSIKRNSIISCNGSSNGEIEAVVNGGVKNYTYQWYKDGNATVIGTTSTLSNLSGGTYYVIITDAKNNIVTSSKYELKEPSILELKLTSDYVNCGIGNDWEVKSTISGGTAPYTYLWSTGDNTSNLKDIKTGAYKLTVVDVNGCKVSNNITIVLPEPLKLDDYSLINPTCYQGNDGEIKLEVAGGAMPYSYKWSNGSVSNTLNNLIEGTYSVIITDNKGCSITESFKITSPEKIKLDLGKDVTLCKGQKIILDGSIKDGVNYSWTSSNGFTSTDSMVEVNESGTYKVISTDKKGCSVTDEIIVKTTNTEISANFIVSTQVFVNESFIAVNVSSPEPEESIWIVPNEGQIIDESGSYVEVLFDKVGEYEITLVTRIGECEEYITKTIYVIENDTDKDVKDSTGSQPMIKDFVVYPNPSNGKFKLDVKLKKENKVNVRIFGMYKNNLISAKKLDGKSEYTIDYDLTLVTGIYVVLIESDKERLVKKIIIK